MSLPEFRYGGMLAEEIANKAKIIFGLKRSEGHTVSLKLAAALEIQKIGIDLFKKVTADYGGVLTNDKLEDIHSKLNSEGQQKFLEGLGGILLGSTIYSLEQGAVNGWDETYFPTSFNLAIVGTVIRPLPKTLSVPKDMVTEIRTPQEEAALIRKTLAKDNTFLSFFGDDAVDKLPQSVFLFLKQRSLWLAAFQSGFWAYKRAIEKLEKL